MISPINYFVGWRNRFTVNLRLLAWLNYTELTLLNEAITSSQGERSSENSWNFC